MNGNDAKFSYGLSKGDAPIHQWILPESQVKETQQKESSKAADSETAATTNGALDAEPTAVGNQDIVCLDQGDATTGEKRKREEEEESTNKQDIIANVFKKARCESNCQNGNAFTQNGLPELCSSHHNYSGYITPPGT